MAPPTAGHEKASPTDAMASRGARTDLERLEAELSRIKKKPGHDEDDVRRAEMRLVGHVAEIERLKGFMSSRSRPYENGASGWQTRSKASAGKGLRTVSPSAQLLKSRGADDAAWSAIGWLTSTDISKCVAEALLHDVDCEESTELAAVRQLAGETEGALVSRLARGALLARLGRVLVSKLAALPDDSAAHGVRQSHAKFAQDGTAFTLSYGDLSTFFGGLEAKVGTPEARIRDAMEREHTAEKDAQAPFTTPNYALTTTPEQEWRFVAEPEAPFVWPAEERCADEHAVTVARLR